MDANLNFPAEYHWLSLHVCFHFTKSSSPVGYLRLPLNFIISLVAIFIFQSFPILPADVVDAVDVVSNRFILLSLSPFFAVAAVNWIYSGWKVMLNMRFVSRPSAIDRLRFKGKSIMESPEGILLLPVKRGRQ